MRVEELRKAIDTALSTLSSPSQEDAEKAVRDLLPPASSDAAALVPFSGYYAITGIDVFPGAFFSIDTSVGYVNYPLTPKVTIHLIIPKIVINVSLDGTKSRSYPFDDGGSFDGKKLIIGDAVNVTLDRTYDEGKLVNLKGTVENAFVTGSTNFNPVDLAVFAASYTSIKNKTTVTVGSSSLQFNSQNVDAFTYNPSMYVANFVAGGFYYTLMLGTQGPCGRVGFILGKGLDGTTTDLVVTTPSDACLASLIP